MRIAIALSLITVVACGDKGKESGKNKPTTDPKAQTPSDAGAEVNKAKPVVITEAAVQSLFDTWLQSQNEGKFEDYEKLYATKFFGVKRAGAKRSEYQRSNWLADRERMFGKPMKVSASGVEIAVTSGTAEVMFEQTWASGKFEDVGAKRLLIVAEGKDLRIAQEEMLASEVTKGRSNGAGNTAKLLMNVEGETYLPLPGIEHHGTTSKPKLVATGPHTAIADVTDQALLTELAQKEYVTDTGCKSSITDLYEIARVEPHFSQDMIWRGTFDDVPGPPSTDDEIAEGIFGHAQLVATLGNCGGTYAWESKDAAIVAGKAETLKDAEKEATEAFVKLPGVVESQADYIAEGNTGNWYEKYLKVQTFVHPTTNETIISVTADNGGICGEWTAAHWAIYKWDGRSLKQLEAFNHANEIVGALDYDRDGKLEFLAKGGFGIDLMIIGQDGEPKEEISYSYQDCPC